VDELLIGDFDIEKYWPECPHEFNRCLVGAREIYIFSMKRDGKIGMAPL